MLDREKRLISELETVETVDSVQSLKPNVFELSGPDCIIIVGADRLGPGNIRDILTDVNVNEYTQILVVLEDIILDLGRTPVVAYSEGHSIEDSSSIVNHIQSIIAGESSAAELSYQGEDVLEQLQKAGLLAFPTPAAAAEMLINWTVSGDPDSILNPGHGTGQFLTKILERTQRDPDSSPPALVGIDTSEIACQMAKLRLGEAATILQQDFLEFGTADRHPDLTDFGLSSDNQNSDSFGGADETSDGEQSPTPVDAVISHLPSFQIGRLPSSVKERIRDRFEHSRLEQAFVLHSLSLLRTGGSGAFLIPQSSLTDSFVESVRSEARIHGFVRLSSSEFITQGIEPVLLFLEKIESGDRSNEPIRLLRIDSPEISDQHKGLMHGSVDSAISRSEDMDDVSLGSVSPSALKPDLLSLALSGPGASSFLFSEAFGELSDVASPHTGLTTGDNGFFYFDSDQIEVSGIPREYFTPVLRKLNDVTGKVTLDDIDHYLLDLREMSDEARSAIGGTPSIGELDEWVERHEEPELLEYLSNHKSLQSRIREQGLEALVPQDLTARVWNPDMVAPGIFDKPRWLLVDIDEDVVFDTTMVGIITNDDIPRKALWTLLNTPLYQRLQSDSSPPFRTSANFSRFLIRDIRSLPIIESCLTNQFQEDVGPLIPTDNAHEEIEIQNRIIETCQLDERRAIDAAFEAFSQDALSWFLSGNELREFSDRIENDENPDEFLISQFGPEVLDDLERMYSRVGFFEGRQEILLDLINLFETERYQTFLVGLAPQFEGILVDFVEATGGRVEPEMREVEQDGEMTEVEVYVFYPSGSQHGKRKDLKRLFDEFFEGEYLRFLQEKVREKRNELTHGTVMDEPDRLAVLLFVAFFAMTNSVLHDYNRHLARIDS